MLSVLIPIYNYDVLKLVLAISAQCKKASIEYEIVCYDDCSKEKFRKENRALDKEFGVSYIELSENKGRSKIRNMLARNARYENILFLDCDSKINQAKFINKYVEAIGKASVVYGGRTYSKHPPKTEKKILHWAWGRKREALSLKERLKFPYRSFQTNNFLTTRDLMLKYPFDESITTYGYEDVLMGENLRNDGESILHIDNTLIHKGVEYTKDFLQKAVLAAENLAELYHAGDIHNTKMIEFHEKVKKIGFNSFLHKQIIRRKDRILKNLNSPKPNLFYFDLYRYELFLSKLNSLSASSS